jgi:uroporphyrinogen decarboxylase
MMTKRERVRASIRRSGFDAIPWQFDLTGMVQDKLKAYYHTEDLLTATDDHIVYVGSRPPQGSTPADAGPGMTRDEFGAVWRRDSADRAVGDWGGLVSCPLKEPSLKGFHFPDGAAPGRWDHLPEIRRKYPDHYLVAFGNGLFEQAWALCGFENYLAYLGTEQTFVEALTQKLADFSCAVTAQLKGLDADAIRFGDDWAFQRTLMMRGATWRRLLKEQYRRIYRAAREAGLTVMIHTCGNITEILPDVIEIGVEVVHAFQPEAMDVAYCQKEFGKNVAFWGGLGSQSTLPNGTPQDVRREVLHRLDLFRDGGYILAPAGAAPTETPPENIDAIVQAAREQLS